MSGLRETVKITNRHLIFRSFAYSKTFATIVVSFIVIFLLLLSVFFSTIFNLSLIIWALSAKRTQHFNYLLLSIIIIAVNRLIFVCQTHNNNDEFIHDCYCFNLWAGWNWYSMVEWVRVHFRGNNCSCLETFNRILIRKRIWVPGLSALCML